MHIWFYFYINKWFPDGGATGSQRAQARPMGLGSSKLVTCP